MLLDPPWYEPGAGKIVRGANRWYPLVKDKDLPDLIRNSGYFLPDLSGCHMWMWATNNHLPMGLKLMEELGFRYITNAVWTKTNFGMGRYLRGKHEILLFGTIGVMLPEIKNISTWIGDKAISTTKHSKKPEESYKLIETISPGPRVEFFARQSRPGWISYGNQLDCDDTIKSDNVDTSIEG
jgi:N6-adenosine-specific RNA methylase IME4